MQNRTVSWENLPIEIKMHIAGFFTDTGTARSMSAVTRIDHCLINDENFKKMFYSYNLLIDKSVFNFDTLPKTLIHPQDVQYKFEAVFQRNVAVYKAYGDFFLTPLKKLFQAI